MHFLEEKADPNYIDRAGSHVLLYAAEKADEAFVKSLLEAGANPAHHNKAMECAAFKAARIHSMHVLELLLLPGQHSPDSPDPEHERKERLSRDLVRKMAQMSGTEVRDLLSRRADFNFRDTRGWTPLTAAVFWGCRDCVEALLKAQHAGHASMRLRLDSRNARGSTALHIAARKGCHELILLLLAARGDPDLQDCEGWTPLHHAAFNGKSMAVSELVGGSASVQIQARNGFTPWMLTKLPTHAGSISDAALHLLQPSEHVDFSKAMVPILKDDARMPYTKLEALMALRGVHEVPKNLRLFEHMFDPRTGPNKVRLQKLWEGLALPMLLRLRDGQTDLDLPGKHLTEEAQADGLMEIGRRQKEQQAFVRQWLLDTKGPRPSPDWRHENRACYGEELRAALAEELAAFKAELDGLYERVLGSEGGAELAAVPDEVLEPRCLTQLGAHPIQLWVEEPDPAGAFEALRVVGAAGMGHNGDASLLSFVELVTINPDFDTGRGFWRNAYRLWLSQYAQIADVEFQKKVRSIVDKFNERYGESNGATLRSAPAKTYERIARQEKAHGQATHLTYEGRTLASKVVDIVRSSISVSSPKAAAILFNEFFRPLHGNEQRLQLVRVINRFNPSAQTEQGYRNIEMSVLWNGGLHPGVCGRAGAFVQISIVGEVRIVLEDFVAVQKRRHLLQKCARGDFDWPPEDAPEDFDSGDGAEDDDLDLPPH